MQGPVLLPVVHADGGHQGCRARILCSQLRQGGEEGGVGRDARHGVVPLVWRGGHLGTRPQPVPAHPRRHVPTGLRVWGTSEKGTTHGACPNAWGLPRVVLLIRRVRLKHKLRTTSTSPGRWAWGHHRPLGGDTARGSRTNTSHTSAHTSYQRNASATVAHGAVRQGARADYTLPT
jgi:hypothetical protein